MGTMRNPRLDLFPITVGISQTNSHSYLTISDCNLVDLAEQHGTPLYLYDRTTMDARVDTYRASPWLAGPYCESGDILIEGLPLPDIKPGELITIPVSGAYQLSMASNYNGACKPAVLWLEEGSARLIQRRESLTELMCRDIKL